MGMQAVRRRTTYEQQDKCYLIGQAQKAACMMV